MCNTDRPDPTDPSNTSAGLGSSDQAGPAPQKTCDAKSGAGPLGLTSSAPTEEELVALLTDLPETHIAASLAPLGGMQACDGGLGRRWLTASGTTTLLFDAEAAGVAQAAREFGIHVRFNRLTEKRNHNLGVMRAIPGTNLWVRSLELDPALRASYGFSVNSPSQQVRPMLGIHRAGGIIQDPANPSVAEEVLDASGAVAARWSLHEGPAAPQPLGSEFFKALPASPPLHKTKLCLDSEQGPQHLDAKLCPAEGDTVKTQGSSGAVPTSALLIVLDADRWNHSPALGSLLAKAHREGVLAPVTWVGISCTSIEQRKALLGGDRRFAASLVQECLRWASATQGVSLSGQVIIAGASVGALCAIHAAQTVPGMLRAAIAQSPSMWYTPARECSPRDFESGAVPPPGHDWPSVSWQPAPSVTSLPTIMVQAGTNEPEILERSAHMAARASSLGWPVTHKAFTGGHDLACWRVELFDALRHLHMQRPLA